MSNAPKDDLFEGTKMTFGEHLEELRGALYKAVIGVVLGVAIAIFFADFIVKKIQVPLKDALVDYYLTKASKELIDKFDGAPPYELLILIKDYGLVPDFVRMEASGILESLKAADPETFRDIHFKPHRFLSSDIKLGMLTDFCARFVAQGEQDTNSPRKAMWQLLSDDQQKTIKAIAKKDSTDRGDEVEVVDILNELVERPELVKSKEFESLDGTIQITQDEWNPFTWMSRWWKTENELETAVGNNVKQMRAELSDDELGTDTATVEKIRRLNKLLIASVFPRTLNRPRRMIVDVPIWKPTDVRVQTLSAHEAFMIWMKAAFIGGLILSSPWIFWQIWDFVAAGLFPHEKKYVYIYLPFSLGLFITGAALAFFFVFAPVLQFLFGFNKLLEVDPDPRISEWLSFVLFLPLGFGVAFQLPLVMLFINRVGIITVDAFLEKWRIAILVIFVISMFLTPADPISMLLMALPLTVLYFLGIILCKWMPRGRNPFFDDAYEP